MCMHVGINNTIKVTNTNYSVETVKERTVYFLKYSMHAAKICTAQMKTTHLATAT